MNNPFSEVVEEAKHTIPAYAEQMEICEDYLNILTNLKRDERLACKAAEVACEEYWKLWSNTPPFDDQDKEALNEIKITQEVFYIARRKVTDAYTAYFKAARIAELIRVSLCRL